jgi:hypothetical protein
MAIETFAAKQHDSYSQARRFARVPAAFPVFIKSDELRMADRALDLSEGGVRVETEEPLPNMSLVALHLELPRGEAVDVIGRVMWVAKGAMGIRFEQRDPVLFETVERLRRELHTI